MILSNDGSVAFHYRSYGTFFYNKIGSMISIGDLPATNIIEPKTTEGSWFYSFLFLCKRSYKEIYVEMNILLEILFTIGYNNKVVILD